MDAKLQKIINSSCQIIDNKIVINSPIKVNGEDYYNGNGKFIFDDEYIFKVSDIFPKGEKVLNFYNFNNLVIANLTIEGNLKQNGITFTSGDYILTDSNDWDTTIQSLWINDCDNVILENIVSNNHSGCGISAKRVNAITIQNCVVKNCFQHGIFVGTSNIKVLINNCLCMAFGDLGYTINKNIGGCGILVSESNNPTISNNKIIGFSDTGTKTEGCSNVEFINNYVDGFGKDGIKAMGYNKNVINVKECKVVNNIIKNKFYGRDDGTSYIAFHEVINGIINGNFIIKDITNDSPNEDGIRVNILSGNSSRNIKIINNTVNIKANSPGINVFSPIDNGIENIVIENNNLNRNILVNNVNKVSIINNFIKETEYFNSKIFVIKSSDIIINKNIIEGLGLIDTNEAIYIQPSSSNYIRVTDNIVEKCGGRFLRITEGSDNKIIENIDIKDNKAEFGMAAISYPVCGIYLGMGNTTINICNILNNSFTTLKTITNTSLYWVHPYTNFIVNLTRIENLTLNMDNAETNLQSQFGRVIGEVYSSIKPTYTNKFKIFDEIKNINPLQNNTKWIFNGSDWIAK
ncbi:right-handed parallel beta-helix repeat-containing protein [Clostridium sp.]|uniref:right-handed parallel beta-helix repeat-containing protein n=1 Tax=Clostridium sp. TaxID=1506 RepID=UPI002635F9D2|nr:right-handed parallel beta-helix repeat-containing protein [Clostridium sp.]